MSTERHSLRRCRYQWRRVGTRTRLLPNDWWRKRCSEATRSDFQNAGPRTRFDRSHAGPGKKRRARLKTVICTAGQTAPATCEDDSQRHRVWPDGRVRRGLQHLKHANVGKQHRETDAETTPLREPDHYQYDFNLADVAEVWRRGSVVASWLLDLTAISFLEQPALERFSGRVSDSGEGRWTVLAAIESTTPAPVLTASLYQRFTSRGEDDFAGKILSAMRFQFGGHIEKKAGH